MVDGQHMDMAACCPALTSQIMYDFCMEADSELSLQETDSACSTDYGIKSQNDLPPIMKIRMHARTAYLCQKSILQAVKPEDIRREFVE